MEQFCKLMPRDYVMRSKTITDLGQDGWELVAVSVDNNRDVVGYFKRLSAPS